MKKDTIDPGDGEKKVCRRKFLNFCGKAALITAAYQIFPIFNNLPPGDPQQIPEPCCPQAVKCVQYFKK
jgi:hypothetical protein